MKVLITGSTYWNSGDDMVRHGVMNLLEAAHLLKHGTRARVEFALFSFTQSEKNTNCSPLAEDWNLINYEDLPMFAKWADVIVVPGLAVGKELTEFFRWVARVGCENKLVFIGGMNENDYCAFHAQNIEREYDAFERAKLIIGRTEKHPVEMEPYHCLPCPSVFAHDVRQGGVPCGPVLFSVQKPHDSPHAVVNHSTDPVAAYQCIDALSTHIKNDGVDDTRVIAHHKSEVYFKDFMGVPVEFYSEERYLHRIYERCRAVVSTRLHAVLRAESIGTPALLVNDTDRHKHALKQFPHIPCTKDRDEIQEWIGTTTDAEETIARMRVIAKHRWSTYNNYMDLLQAIV